MYRTSLILLLLLLPFRGSAQSSTGTADSLTYALYLRGDWKDLVSTGNKALEGGIDFYYLRMRMGIAYFRLERYASAAIQFQAAIDFKPEDAVAGEYLYYSLLYSGREEDARAFLYQFSAEEQGRILGRKPPTLQQASGSFLFQQSLKNPAEHFTPPAAGEDGYQTIPLQFIDFSANLSHYAGKRSVLNYQYTFLQKDYFQFYREEGINGTSSDKQLTENLLYLSHSFRLAKGLFLQSSVHLLQVRIPGETTSGFGGQSRSPDLLLYDQLLGAGLKKYFGRIRAEGSFSYSTIHESRQYQGTGSILFLPAGNLNLYVSGSYLWHKEAFPGGSTITGQGFIQFGGLRIHRHLWLEEQVMFGNLRHFNLDAGRYVYNNDESLRRQYTVYFLLPFVQDRLHLRLGYSYSTWESDYMLMTGEPVDGNTHAYQTQNFSGGLLWKF